MSAEQTPGRRLHTTTEKWVLDEPVLAQGYSRPVLITVVKRTTWHAENDVVSWSFLGRTATKNGKPHPSSTVDHRFLPDDEVDRLVALLWGEG